MKQRTTVFATMIFAAIAVMVPASVASASPARASSFVAQARSAGLTTDQARVVQQRVDQYLASNRGDQVAFNQIELADGGQISLAYPGQVKPDFTCYVGDFCGYSKPNRAGDAFAKSACNSPVNITWGATGSWWNNQTGGARAKFYTAPNGGGSLWYTTPAAPSSSNSYNWAQVSSAIVC